MTTLECERCKCVKPCFFFGTPADVANDKPQSGEWICNDCVPLREAELDVAYAEMRQKMGDTSKCPDRRPDGVDRRRGGCRPQGNR